MEFLFFNIHIRLCLISFCDNTFNDSLFYFYLWENNIMESQSQTTKFQVSLINYSMKCNNNQGIAFLFTSIFP